VFAFLLLYVPPASVVGIVISHLTGSVGILYRLGRFGVRTALVLARTRIVTSGLEHLAETRNTVVMPNHVSHLDAPVLFEVLGVDFKALVKAELFRLPFFGRVLLRAGFIPVHREDKEKARLAVDAAIASLREGHCFLVFPEGTRSRTGALGDFRKGAFVAAVQAGSRILPVAVRGTRELMPRGGFRIRRGTVEVRVLDPLDAGSYSYDDRDRLLAEVRSRIAAALS
jgi:1-acyl-sn-glycerol-3-phosphate acyltransferase